jgi:hypothetical protein
MEDIMGSIDGFKNALNLFNEKAVKLNRMSFTKIMLTEQTGFSLSIEKTDEDRFKGQASVTGPGEESVDALLLTIRFFTMSNESSSFAKLNEFYEKSGIPQELKDEFHKVRAELNEFLDSRGSINIEFNADELTNRVIFNTMIYGGTAHANDSVAVARFRNWMKMPVFIPLIMNEFNYILARFVGYVGTAWEINKRALAYLEKPSTGSS